METFAERIEREHQERWEREHRRLVEVPKLDKDGCDICELCKKRLFQGEPVFQPQPNVCYFDAGGAVRRFWHHVKCQEAADEARARQADIAADNRHPDLVVQGLTDRVEALEAKRR